MKFLRKVAKFLWDDESIWSWIANVIIAFIVIKYLLYPGLGLILGTPAPIVAVVSGSMEHDGNFETFWLREQCCNAACTVKLQQGAYYERINISQEEFRAFSFVNGFDKGDIMILANPNDAKVGDVIVYVVPGRPDPIIHRVVRVEEAGKKFYWTKGDHNCDIGEFEKRIPQEHVIGKAIWKLPWLGWIKIIAVELVGGF